MTNIESVQYRATLATTGYKQEKALRGTRLGISITMRMAKKNDTLLQNYK